MSSDKKSELEKLMQLKIGLFGKKSSGKSALINVLIGEDEVNVSERQQSQFTKRWIFKVSKQWPLLTQQD